ncbi:MAG TPA: cation:proton antiporter [Trebonia sp.]|nr:cation:proton antiporter [Trebonia sp.]
MSATAVAELLAALVVIIALARAFGALARRCGQPAVVGEILVGIVLGPTFFGVGLANHLFPLGGTNPMAGVRPALTGIGDLGLVLFMFIVGYELDRKLVLSSGRATVSVAIGSIIAPLGLGVALGFWLAHQQDAAQRLPFALFIGVATAITAFPVLARILAERGMQRTRIGSLALAAASVNDVLAWILLASVVIVAKSASSGDWRLLLLPVYVLVIAVAVRPLMNALARFRLKAGRLTPDLLAVILVVVLISAYATEWMGLNFIFGAFIVGAVMPRDGAEQLRVEVLERLEHAAVLVLLPVYFVLAGVTVDLAHFDGRDGLDLALILSVAMVGKFGGAYVSGRLTGILPRQAGALATLMNTRGLTEIVILTTGLQLGIVSVRLYSLMVVMALVTTAMAGPVLNVIYPARFVRRDIAEANQAALGEPAVYRVLAATVSSTQTPVASGVGSSTLPSRADDAVLAVGAALAAAREHAEVIIGAVLPYRTPRLEVGGGIAQEMLELTEEMARLEEARGTLEARGIKAKPTARLAADPAAELADLASSASVLVIAADHPGHGEITEATAVPVEVTVAAEAPEQWSSVVVRAGTGTAASAAAAEVAGLLAAGSGTGVIIDPAGQGGRGLDRFVGLLRDAGLSTEISGQAPDGALVVTRGDGPVAGAHVIVRAGPSYTPAESAPLAVADLGQEDR